MIRSATLMLATTLLVASDEEPTWRKATQAFDQGDLRAAARLYESMQVRTPEPRRVAFNLATVRYHQARNGDAQALAEAEILYRCCLERDDPHRPDALLGLGNCLLMRGTTGKLDSLALRLAIDRYTECLRTPKGSPTVHQDAAYNQQRARLCLVQAPPATAPAEPEVGEDGSKEGPQEQPRPEQRTSVGKPAAGKEKGKGKERLSPETKDGTQGERSTPGKGALPPVADSDQAPPLAPGDALEHLSLARQRILEDLLRHRRQRPRPAATEVRDW